MNSNGSGISAPVSVVVIGVENLDTSLEFYAGTIGLEVTETRTWQGPEFEHYWQVPARTTARCAFLSHGADPVGRIQLMEFDSPDRKLIRQPGIKRATGLFNINLYTSDIQKDYEQLSAQGFEFWSAPAHADFGPGVGETMEVAFDGPDGVVINLVDGSTKEGVILKKEGLKIKYIDIQTHRPEDIDISEIKSIGYADKVYDLEGNVITDDQIGDAKGMSKTLAYGFGGLVLGAAVGFGIGALMQSDDIAIGVPMAILGVAGGVYFGLKGSTSDKEDAIDDIRAERYEVSQAELKKKLENEKKRLEDQKQKQEQLKKDIEKKKQE